MQKTVISEISISGVGLHSGVYVTLSVLPAPADHGIVFKRTDIHKDRAFVPARWDKVVNTRLCTVIGNSNGVTVQTIEHLMAAFAGCGIDNALVELNGPEVPATDGSSAPFVSMIKAAGIEKQNKPRRFIEIVKDVSVTLGDKKAILRKHEGHNFVTHIDFDHPVIGAQSFEFDGISGSFENEIAPARTYGFLDDVKALRKMGLALGGSTDNALVLDHNVILNEDGLRFPDEFVRHKLLDAMGDLYLAGPIIGSYESWRGGHELNNAILHELKAKPDCYRIVQEDFYREDAGASYLCISRKKGFPSSSKAVA